MEINRSVICVSRESCFFFWCGGESSTARRRISANEVRAHTEVFCSVVISGRCEGQSRVTGDHIVARSAQQGTGRHVVADTFKCHSEWYEGQRRVTAISRRSSLRTLLPQTAILCDAAKIELLDVLDTQRRAISIILRRKFKIQHSSKLGT